MARDVRDARVPRRPWMAESGPDRMGLPAVGLSSLRSSDRTGFYPVTTDG
jgi:hypothetical protein